MFYKLFLVILNFSLVNSYYIWEPYRWYQYPETPVDVIVGNCHTISTKNVDWSNILPNVIDKWNNIPEFQDGTGQVFNSQFINIHLTSCDTINDGAYRIQVFNDDYGSSGWLGIASLWAFAPDENGIQEIYKVESKVNEFYIQPMANGDTYSRFSNPNAWRHVLCHEVGHGLPLGHPDTSGKDLDTCMDYDYNLDNIYPGYLDNDLLEIMYGYEVSTPAPTPAPTPKPKGKSGGKGKKPNLSAMNHKIDYRNISSFGKKIGKHTYLLKIGDMEIITEVLHV